MGIPLTTIVKLLAIQKIDRELESLRWMEQTGVFDVFGFEPVKVVGERVIGVPIQERFDGDFRNVRLRWCSKDGLHFFSGLVSCVIGPAPRGSQPLKEVIVFSKLITGPHPAFSHVYDWP